jgi:hypothetical protein
MVTFTILDVKYISQQNNAGQMVSNDNALHYTALATYILGGLEATVGLGQSNF